MIVTVESNVIKQKSKKKCNLVVEWDLGMLVPIDDKVILANFIQSTNYVIYVLCNFLFGDKNVTCKSVSTLIFLSVAVIEYISTQKLEIWSKFL